MCLILTLNTRLFQYLNNALSSITNDVTWIMKEKKKSSKKVKNEFKKTVLLKNNIKGT